MSRWIVAIVIAFLTVGGASASAQTFGAPPPRAAAEPATPDRAALMQALLTFVLDDYLGSGRPDHVNRPEIYAERVDYYQRGRLSRSAVMADKAAYYRRWPSRLYVYVPETLRIENAGEAGVTITFRHRYIVSDGARRASGVAVTRLGVTLDDDRFVVVREGGVVERRGG